MQSEITMPAGVVPIVAAAHPFRQEVTRLELPEGATLADMLAAAQPDPVLRAHAHIFIDGDLIAPEHYGIVKPKPGHEITIRVVPAGGGDSKSTIRLIGILVITIVASVIGQVYVGPLLAGSLGATGAAASAIAAGTGIAFPVAGPLHVAATLPARPLP